MAALETISSSAPLMRTSLIIPPTFGESLEFLSRHRVVLTAGVEGSMCCSLGYVHRIVALISSINSRRGQPQFGFDSS